MKIISVASKILDALIAIVIILLLISLLVFSILMMTNIVSAALVGWISIGLCGAGLGIAAVGFICRIISNVNDCILIGKQEESYAKLNNSYEVGKGARQNSLDKRVDILNNDLLQNGGKPKQDSGEPGDGDFFEEINLKK